MKLVLFFVLIAVSIAAFLYSAYLWLFDPVGFSSELDEANR